MLPRYSVRRNLGFTLSNVPVWLVVTASILFHSCGDPVPDFRGFTWREMSFLLSGARGKTWLLISRTENGAVVNGTACAAGEYLIFMTDSAGRGLFYGIPPEICQENQFCTSKPWICAVDSANCVIEPEICEEKPDGIFWLGSWSVPRGLTPDAAVDEVIFETPLQNINASVLRITASQLELSYTHTLNGAETLVMEEYRYTSP